MAMPRGTNEVERLADLVGPIVRAGDMVCARAFQAAVACANADRGTLAWTKNVGGLQPAGGDGELIAAGDASDRITAWKTAGGDVAWSHERFLNRGLSAPAAFGRTLAFGDAEGYVHFLSRENGETLLRLPTDGTPVVAAPVRVGGTLVVATRAGGVYGLKLD